MTSPVQIASTISSGFLYSPHRRITVLCDGSLLAATTTATGTLGLEICTNPTAATQTWSALSQTFAIASTVSIVADLYVDPTQFGGATCDVWLVYASNDGSNGASVLCAHATYTASGSSWSWSNTATVVASTSVAGQGVPSILWNGTDLICIFRDGSTTSDHSVQICYTTTKNGSAGWTAKAALSSVTTGNSHMICALRHHGSNLGGGGAAGTVAVYILDTGSHSDQIACRVLLDSAATAAPANWGTEAKQAATAQSGIGLCATVDPANGQINIGWTSTVAAGSIGVNYATVTVATTTCTWGTHYNPVTTSTIASAGIAVDVKSRVYLFYCTGSVGTSGVVDYEYTDNSGSSWSGVQTTVAATTGDGYPRVPADYGMSAYVPFAFQRGTATYSSQSDNTITAQVAGTTYQLTGAGAVIVSGTAGLTAELTPAAAGAVVVSAAAVITAHPAVLVASGSAVVSASAAQQQIITGALAAGATVVSGAAVDTTGKLVAGSGAVVVSGAAVVTEQPAVLLASGAIVVSATAVLTALPAPTAAGAVVVSGAAVQTAIGVLLAAGDVVISGTAAVGDISTYLGLTVSTQTQSGISGGPPGNGTTETDVSWQNASGNGWAVGDIIAYGGMPWSSRYEITAGVWSINQTSLSTSSPDGFIHVLSNNAGTFTGSENPTFTMTELAPTGQTFRRYYDTGTVVPSTGPQLGYRIRTVVQPGDPGLIFHRVDISNASGSAVTLNGADGMEIAMIGGLLTANQGGANAWPGTSGLYATVGGTETAWPGDTSPGPVTANPDYVYITPAGGSGLSVTEFCVRITGLVEASIGTTAKISYLGPPDAASSRVKVKVQVTVSSFPGSTTKTLYYVQGFLRSAGAGDINAIAADLLNPDAAGAWTVGTGASYSYDEGSNVAAAASNVATLTHTFPTHVTVRRKPFYKLTNWTGSVAPIPTLGGVALVANTDYLSFVDVTNHIGYVKLLFDLVASGAGTGQKNNAALAFGTGVTIWSATAAGGVIVSGTAAQQAITVGALAAGAVVASGAAVQTVTPAVVVASGAAVVSGAAAQVALGVELASGDAVVSATAAQIALAVLLAAGGVKASGSAVDTALGVVLASGDAIISATAAQAALAALLASGTAIVAGTASQTAEGVLSAAGVVIVSGTAVPSGISTWQVTAAGAVVVSASSALADLALLVTAGSALASGTAAVSDVGYVLSNGSVVVSASAALLAVAAPLASGAVVVSGSALQAAITVALLATGAVIISGGAMPQATGSVGSATAAGSLRSTAANSGGQGSTAGASGGGKATATAAGHYP